MKLLAKMSTLEKVEEISKFISSIDCSEGEDSDLYYLINACFALAAELEISMLDSIISCVRDYTETSYSYYKSDLIEELDDIFKYNLKVWKRYQNDPLYFRYDLGLSEKAIDNIDKTISISLEFYALSKIYN